MWIARSSWLRSSRSHIRRAAFSAWSISIGVVHRRISRRPSCSIRGTVRRSDILAGILRARRAIEIDPLDVYALQNLAKFLRASADYAGARETLHRAREISPRSWELFYDSGLVELLDGHAAEALAASRQISLEGHRWTLEAMARHSLGQTEEARRLTADLIKKRGLSQPYAIALVFAWCGETDRAFEWLNRAYAAHDDRMEDVKYEPLLAPLRTDPRYQALLRTMNLPT
jgi:tetratricopeptide (TPR) repeat protein